jgi:hypothetical protein
MLTMPNSSLMVNNETNADKIRESAFAKDIGIYQQFLISM